MNFRATEIFAQAYVTDPEEREALLEEACGEDQALRAEVERMLKDSDSAEALFGGRENDDDDETGDSAALSTPGGDEWQDSEGDVVGPYTLMEKIGEGGFGTVWRAEQHEPISRMVAVKVVKAGMDTKQVLARFEAERQALAVLDHPNIAKVIDAGATPHGRPYFAMELVDGIPITEFCVQYRLDTQARLKLFQKVCSAVNHSHQKGIIHRDLKPSNVLVSQRGDTPVPKVIDFGIAKATEEKLTEKTLFTRHAQLLGTPSYMSPEQAAMSDLDIDTRTDIYSLGILLYELLTGKPPFDPKTLIAAGYDEMRRIIMEEEPLRPSTKLTASLQTAHPRRRKLPTATLPHDLDWIVMKAIEKERARRYGTANAFAADIQRFLADEPVQAAAPSASYKVGKFVKRNKTAMLVASAMVMLLVAGTTVSTWQAIKANKATHEATASEAKAQASANQAQKRLQQVEKANDILGSIFQSLDPDRIASQDLPLQAILVEQLDEAVEQLKGEAIGDPVVVAKMQSKLGISLYQLGEAEKAIVPLENAVKTLERELGETNRETVVANSFLAGAYQRSLQPERSLPVLERLLQIQEKAYGPLHPDTLLTGTGLAKAHQKTQRFELAIPLFEQTLSLWKEKLNYENDIGYLSAITNLANAYGEAGQAEQASALLANTRALELAQSIHGPHHPTTFLVMGSVSGAWMESGKIKEGLQIAIEARKLAEKHLGPDHSHTLNVMSNLGAYFSTAGRLDESVAMLGLALDRVENKYGKEHPLALSCMNHLGITHSQRGEHKQALQVFQDVLNRSERLLGPNHFRTHVTRHSIAKTYLKLGEVSKALQTAKEALGPLREILGPDSTRVLAVETTIARVHLSQGRPDLVIPMLEKSLALREDMNPGIADVFKAMHQLAQAYNMTRAFEKAIPLFEALKAADLSDNHPEIFSIVSMLGHSYFSLGKYAQSVPVMEEFVAIATRVHGPHHAQTLFAKKNLAVNYKDSGRLQEAAALFEEILPLVETSDPDGAIAKRQKFPPMSTTNIRIALGVTFWMGGESEKAIPIFEDLVRDLEEKHGRNHPKTLEQIGNLGVNYHDNGDHEKAIPFLEEVYESDPDWVSVKLLASYALTQRSSAALKLGNALIDEAKKLFPPESADLAGQLAFVGLLWEQGGLAKEAEPVVRECLRIRKQELPADSWLIFNVMSILGSTLHSQGKDLEEAERLLVDGYDGMVQNKDSIPMGGRKRISESLDRLVRFYESRGQPGDREKAADYRRLAEKGTK